MQGGARMKYTIYEQRMPKRVPDRFISGEICWEANLVKIGEVEAIDSEEAFKKAKKITAKPVLESDASRMISHEERLFYRTIREDSRYS
jgi:hypothetical protein